MNEKVLPGEMLSMALREQTPAAGYAETRGWSYFDGPSGTQMIESAIGTMAGYARHGMSNRHGISPAGDETEALVGRARSELRGLFNAADYEVVFGQNMTSLAFSFAHALARLRGRRGARVATTELEHRANVDPWFQSFAVHGGEEFWIRIDSETLRLDESDIEQAGGDHLALVAATAAANAVGVKPDLSRLRDLAEHAGAIFVVDGVHVVPHDPPDLGELAPDIFFCSGYKFYGPHVGVALVRRELCEELTAFKVLPAPQHGAEKFETGSQNHEGIAGLLAAVDALARLSGLSGGPGARATLQALGHHESELLAWILGQLRSMRGVKIVGHDNVSDDWVATVAFTIAGRPPLEIATALRAEGVFVTSGDFYATPLAARLGVEHGGGWVRAGLAGYTSYNDAHHLVEALTKVIGG
ncbi:MAG: aminotransferase class V-fold PLP-dependent enzyme [Acidimicrobiales bacterium]